MPSPQPTKILELDTIAALVEQGELVICCGGGGIPVLWSNDAYRGAPAVIDKDLTSALLATQLKATQLVMLTPVEHAYIDYRKSTQRALERLTVDEAEQLIEQGHFAAGSMLPKMEAAMTLSEPALISRARRRSSPVPTSCCDALEGTTGTRIVGG